MPTQAAPGDHAASASMRRAKPTPRRIAARRLARPDDRRGVPPGAVHSGWQDKAARCHCPVAAGAAEVAAAEVEAVSEQADQALASVQVATVRDTAARAAWGTALRATAVRYRPRPRDTRCN